MTQSLPKLNSKAPLFKLLNQDGDEISLSNFFPQNRVVLYFYPKALTSGCTVQACSLRDSLEIFKKNKIVVLGISGDPVKKLKQFQEKEGLTFDLLSDPTLEVVKNYGAWGPKKLYGKEYMGIYRYTFILNEEGNIVHIMDKVNTKTHHEELKKYFRLG